MNLSRRELMRLSASSLLACGAGVPLFLARTARAVAGEPGAKSKGRVLVVVQLDGGNDGLNTVVPYKDDDYRKARPMLQLAEKVVLKIDDHVGFHPALTGFAKLLERRQLAVVQSVGYPNPNRSHFDSMAIWHTAKAGTVTWDADKGYSRDDTPGWLARALDATPPAPGRDVPAMHISSGLLPQALAGGQRHVPSLASLEQFRRRLGLPEQAGAAAQRAALDRVASRAHGRPGSLLSFVEGSAALTYQSSARLERVAVAGPGAGYPETGLGQQLRLIAQLVKAGLTTSIYYSQLDGFDTHAGQLPRHDSLLRDLGASVQAFVADLVKSGDGDRVVVLMFSEFGRRLVETPSAGTDHGTAGPVFLAGPAVKAGLHGPYPNLRDLDEDDPKYRGGDPKFAIDFRRVYATLLDKWLGCPADKVLGAKHKPLPLI
jgi:uncharacterized protein (DUF1501 family)